MVWEIDGVSGHGVYIPRRDTDSRLSVLLGGRLFPGEHHRAHLDVTEGDGRYDIAMHSTDATNRIEVRAREVRELSHGSIFRDVDDASEFFRETRSATPTLASPIATTVWSSRPRSGRSIRSRSST